MNSFIKKILDVYKNSKEYDRKREREDLAFIDKIRALEDKMEKDFYKKFPNREERNRAWGELENLLENEIDKERLEYLANRNQKDKDSDLSTPSRYGTIGALLAFMGYYINIIQEFTKGVVLKKDKGSDKLLDFIMKILEDIFKLKKEQALILLVTIYPTIKGLLRIALMPIAIVLGKEVGYLVGAIKVALLEEIRNRKKSKNEDLRNSLDYHFYKLYEEQMEDEELQKKRDTVTKDRNNYILGDKIMRSLLNIPIVAAFLYVLREILFSQVYNQLETLMKKYPEYTRNCINNFFNKNKSNLLRLPGEVSVDPSIINVEKPSPEFMKSLFKNGKLADKIVFLQKMLNKIPYFGKINILDIDQDFIYKDPITGISNYGIKGYKLENLYNKKLPFVILIGSLCFLFGMKAVREIYDKLKKKDEQSKSKNEVFNF